MGAPGQEQSGYFQAHLARLVRMLQLIPTGGAEDRILEMGCYLQITPALQKTLGYGEVSGCYLGKSGYENRTVKSRDGDIFQCQIDLFDAEVDCFPYPSNYFRTVICGELLGYLQSDPMHMVYEIHRVLKPDGVLVLTTPNAVSLRAVASVVRGSHPAFYSSYPHPLSVQAAERRPVREYTPPEVSRLLTDAGFLVVHVETGPYRKEERDLGWAAAILKSGKFAANLRGECIYAVGRKAAIPRQRYPDWLYDF
jgi:SAM-dependent methyltransferase